MRFKNVLLCTFTNYRKWIVNPTIYTLFILIFAFSLWNFSGIHEYAKAVGYDISPWMFPHILNNVTLPIYSSFAVLLFSNTPFIDRHMPFLVVRTGRLSWYSKCLLVNMWNFSIEYFIKNLPSRNALDAGDFFTYF